MIKNLKHISKEELLGMLSPTGKKQVNQNSGLRGPEAWVVFENRVPESPELGKRTVIAVGPNHLYNTVAELRGAWLHEGEHKQTALYYSLTK